jgi:type I restriction enzyme S subunit
MTGTSGRQRVENSAFAEIEFIAPSDLSEQSRIASILSTLDDKIELNLHMNKTLEAIAQAIFKEWFVDFRFPGFDGEMVDALPKGWSQHSIESLISYNVGGDWGKEELSDDFPIKVAIIRGTDFPNIQNGDISKVPIRYIKRANLLKREIKNGDILIEISGGSNEQPTGRTIMITESILKLFDYPVVPASFCRLIRPFNFNESIFLSTFFSRFYLLGGTWEYQNQSTGISKFQFSYFIKNKKLALPKSNYLIDNFGTIVCPMVEMMGRNINQVKTLSQIRDLLLPKLMTGKIRVA